MTYAYGQTENGRRKGEGKERKERKKERSRREALFVAEEEGGKGRRMDEEELEKSRERGSRRGEKGEE